MKGNIAEVKKELSVIFLFWGIIEYIIHCRIRKIRSAYQDKWFFTMVFALSSCNAMVFLWLELGEDIMKNSFFERCNRSYQMFTEEALRVSQKYEDVKFCVLQCEPKFQNFINLYHIIRNISDFYNENWLGNADYVHVPDSKGVWNNYLKYPIILAYREIDGFNEILGVSTIKYFQNDSQFVNPYYPLPNKKYFEVTGILVKQNSDIKNIGKHIYEIVLKGLKKYHEILPDFDVIFVADCRNYMSINGACGGARFTRLGNSQNVFGKLIGIYTMKKDNELIEAPTFVAKFSFDEPYFHSKPITFDYQISENLFSDLLSNLYLNLHEYKMKPGIENYDEDAIVTFYELENNNINLDDITILPNGTDLGNDRIPWVRKRVKTHE